MAGMAKYYFLVPNFLLGKINLGDIIINPYNPYSVLTTADAGCSFPSAEEVVVTDCKLSFHSKPALKFQRRLFSSASSVSVGVGTTISDDVASEYRINTLKTIFCNSLPAEYIEERIRDQRVESTMKGGVFRRNHSVYMVTGMKVAIDLEVATSISGSDGGQVKRAAISEVFCVPGEAIIAYRLKKIELVGGKANDINIKDFTSKAAFM
ncbi:hypothetical protein AOQ84DRAFT_389068 [Glonium stellatum]|uniref:Uncharacterized protein n=1 Tax=Glonium stellatum TaxID=574774 RepID=A0A8E2JST9_9PEZI|nr:hypothetical protein AOQ84DRAFT_389068 [Glonium stellatum]